MAGRALISLTLFAVDIASYEAYTTNQICNTAFCIMDTIDRISVLIAAYRNADLLKRCVESLRAAFGGRLPETVIVDDAAGDEETRKVVEGFLEDGVKFVVSPENRGFAGANNLGWPHCTKEFVVLVNDDIMFHDEPFSAMLEFMDAHPKAGIAQGTVVIRNGQPGVDGSLNGCGAFMTVFGTAVTPGWLKPADDPVAKSARRCFAACGAMFMIRRGVVESTGRPVPFYDFFHSYYEEVDLCHRAWLVGWEVWYIPTPPVDHVHSATFGKFCAREEVLRRFYRNMRFSFATCFGWRGRLTIRPMFELACLVQSALMLLRGQGLAWRAHRWAKHELKGLRSEIATARRLIQSTRVSSDTTLFKVIRKNYSMADLWNYVMRKNW